MSLTLIETKTVGAGGSASIDFTSIPATFTDLQIVLSLRDDFSNISNDANFYINGSLITFKQLYGTGVNVGSNNPTQIARPIVSATATANTFGSTSIYIANYASSSIKTISTDSVSENKGTECYQVLGAGIYSSAAAISSISIDNGSATFVAGSTASLYGVTKWVQPPAKATGGAMSYSGGYWYHAFTASGTFTPTEALTADLLMVGGGGGGGVGSGGGGGGAGGIKYIAAQALSPIGYTVAVGAGGPGASTTNGTAGNNSSINGFAAAIGGGYGSGYAGGLGGSGGGGGGVGSGNVGGAGTAGQGYAGGAGNATSQSAGGGGGAGAAGAVGYMGGGGAGGAGVNTYAAWSTATGTGQSGLYAGGGGGGAHPSWVAGPGGTGGGGAGAASANGTPGAASTGGGGGGGAGNTAYPAQAGGSGIVIVRYAA